MNVRLIAGNFGGRNLKAPDGGVTHPMSERVRGALFNIINSRLAGAVVLDAFSGSGVIGLEAVSRGAKHVVFIERDRVASDILAQNIKLLGVENSTTIYKISVSAWIDKITSDKFDVIFVDPPYDDMQLSTVERLCGLLKPKGLMVLSYPGRSEVPKFDGFVVVDNRSYGNASLAFYQKEE